MSSCYAYQFHAMQAYAASKNVSLPSPLYTQSLATDFTFALQQAKFVSMQDFYNPVYREEEREMFPTCKVRGTLSPCLPNTCLSASGLSSSTHADSLSRYNSALWRWHHPLVAPRSWLPHSPLEVPGEQHHSRSNRPELRKVRRPGQPQRRGLPSGHQRGYREGRQRPRLQHGAGERLPFSANLWKSMLIFVSNRSPSLGSSPTPTLPLPSSVPPSSTASRSLSRPLTSSSPKRRSPRLARLTSPVRSLVTLE